MGNDCCSYHSFSIDSLIRHHSAERQLNCGMSAELLYGTLKVGSLRTVASGDFEGFFKGCA